MQIYYPKAHENPLSFIHPLGDYLNHKDKLFQHPFFSRFFLLDVTEKKASYEKKHVMKKPSKTFLAVLPFPSNFFNV